MGIETALIASAVVGVVSAGVGAYSQVQQGQAQKANANYQSQVAANNATLSRINAEQARAAAAREVSAANSAEQDNVRKSRAMIGSQVASTASRGLLVNEGSALDIRSGTADLYNESGQNIQATGAQRNADQFIRAFNYETQGSSYNAEGAMMQAAGGAASSAGWLSGTATGLGGVANAASTYAMKYADMKRTGTSFSGTRVE